MAWILGAALVLAAGAAPSAAGAGPRHPFPGAWPQSQFDHRHSGFNRYEDVLSPSNVGGLTQAWSAPIDFYLNAAAVVRGVVYTTTSGDEHPGVYALDAGTGHRLWYQGSVGYVSWAP